MTVSNTGNPTITPACPIDREWISKLILAHSPNPNNGKALVCAPMVDQSELPFRLLCRKYGTNVAFTPMIHASLLTRSDRYQSTFLPTHRHESDRPLIAQLCGHDPDILEKAAEMIAPFCDGIDLNCGCPQGIAKRGFYGAYLLEEEEILLKCVRRLTSRINKPISVKVRLLYKQEDKSIDPDASMRLYKKLVDSGIHLLTIHGRTRHQLHCHTGSADWNIIKQVVDELGHKIPIFANGNIGSMADVQRCFQETGVDGVMSSEALLEYPALFLGDHIRIGRIQLAKEYLTIAKQYPPKQHNQGSGIKCLKAHVHRFLHADLEQGNDHVLRQRIAQAPDWQSLWDTVEHIERMHETEEHKVEEESLCWYMRHRVTVTDAQGNEMTALELKYMQDTGAVSAKQQHAYEDEEEDLPLETTCFFGDDGDDGDY